MKSKVNIAVAFLIFMMLLMVSKPEAANITISSGTLAPSNGASNVTLNSTITFTITPVAGKTLQTSSVTASTFIVKDISGTQVSGGITFSGNKAILTPSSPLTDCMSYTATVISGGSGVKDTGGNTLASDKVWSFTTLVNAPTVTSTTPANGATGVLQASQLTAVFSEPMTASTITNSTFVMQCGGTAITGTVMLDTGTDPTGKTARFIPAANLPSASTCIASITTGAKDDDPALYCSGPTPLAANKNWSFTVRDYVAPAIVLVTPADGSLNVVVNTTVTATFSEMVLPSTINTTNFYLQDASGTTVTATVTLDATQKIATLTPSSNLGFSATYTATVTTGVTDLAGNPMVSPKIWSFSTQPPPMATYCDVPPFVTSPLAPNVLLVLDNSNSMDEDFLGNAVGSFASNSKSVVGRKALQSIINTYINAMRIGLMTYKLPSVSSQTLSNAPYFVSYDPKSYCPFPPPRCADWCKTGSASYQNTCRTACRAQNPVFDETYFDEVISSRAIGDATRSKYCDLVYPKTTQLMNPTDNTNFVYYKQSLPCYGCAGIEFDYSTGYNPLTEITTTGPSAGCYTGSCTKTGSSDANSGYSGSCGGGCFTPTDDDLANGYGNFGRRMFSTQVGQAWFANSSPGAGYLQVSATDNNPPTNTQLTALLNKLATKENDQAGYMAAACNGGSSNTCPFIINAGLTPTAGTLQSASDYFTGASSPIQYRCQKNFIIYVTDGLPSVDTTGNTVNDVNLLMTDSTNGVLKKLDNLRAITKALSGTNYTFDVKTFVVGLGMTSGARANLDSMAVHGGAAVNGGAYYADNLAQLNSGLSDIFQNILNRVSSGTAASVLASGEGSGANIVQAVFYPLRTYTGGEQVSWVGTLQNMWYYLDLTSQNSTIREDTDHDMNLELTDDYITNYRFDQTLQATVVDLYVDANGDNVPDSPSTPSSTVGVEDLNYLWEAGTELWKRTTSRRILTTTGSGLIDFTPANRTTLKPFLQAANDDEAEAIIDYVSGQDKPTVNGVTYNYRSRTTRVDLNHDNDVTDSGEEAKVWKLGDIINSTPRIESWLPLNSYDKTYQDLTYSNPMDSAHPGFLESSAYLNRGAVDSGGTPHGSGVVFTGGNDGMLHAFKLGAFEVVSDGTSKKASMLNADPSVPLGTELWSFIPKNSLPYLRYITDPAYCHLYYIDASPAIFDASIARDTGVSQPASCIDTLDMTDHTKGYWNCNKTSSSWRTILIGSMREGGACKGAGSTYGVPTPASGKGYSSYFALDVTDPANPSLLWEFSDPNMGFSTTGPAVVRINAMDPPADSTKAGSPNKSYNGKWFVVIASGPTGPIDTANHQFKGFSDQDLRFYILDLKTGTLLRTIDTGIANAFGGSLNNATADYNLDYSDDAVYEGYTRAEASPVTSSTRWTQGGVIRLVTKSGLNGGVGPAYSVDNTALNPGNWEWHYLAKDIGSVTSDIGHIAHYPTNSKTPDKGYLFFGTGRYFFKTSEIDSANIQSNLFGVLDPCLTKITANNLSLSLPLCDDAIPTNTVCSGANDIVDTGSHSCLGNATAGPNTNANGWYINLDNPSSGSILAERMITDPLITSQGIVFFTTFAPSTDVCDYGGTAYLWTMRYDNGGTVQGMLSGKALLQVSTGVIAQISLASAFTDKVNRRTDASLIKGVPPTGQGLSLVVPPKPTNRMQHLRKQ